MVGVSQCASHGLIVIRLWLRWNRLAPHWNIGIDALAKGRLGLTLRGELLGVPLESLRAETEVSER